MSDFKIASKTRFLSGILKRQLKYCSRIKQLWINLEKEKICYQYTKENELIVEAMSHQAVDYALTKLSQYEENLVVLQELEKVSPQKIKILKQIKNNPLFEKEPEWLSQVEIIEKENQQEVLFKGRNSEIIENQLRFRGLIEDLIEEEYTSLRVVDVDYLTRINEDQNKSSLQEIMEGNKCIIIGDQPNQENKSLHFCTLDRASRNKFIEDLQSITQNIREEQVWKDNVQVHDHLQLNHFLEYFAQLKRQQVKELVILPKGFQIELQLPMKIASKETQDLVQNVPKQVNAQYIKFQAEHLTSLENSKPFLELLSSSGFVAYQFLEQTSSIRLRSFKPAELKILFDKVKDFLQYEIKLPFKMQVQEPQTIRCLKTLIPLKAQLKQKWKDFPSLQALNNLKFYQEGFKNEEAYFIKFIATQYQKQKILEKIKELQNSLSFQTYLVKPLTNALLKLKRKDGTSFLDEIQNMNQLFCHEVFPLSYETIIRKVQNYEKEEQQCSILLNQLQVLVKKKFLSVQERGMKKIEKLLGFQGSPQYLTKLNCVLEIANGKGVSIYYLEEDDLQVLLEFFKIIEQNFKPVFNFKVITNSALLVKNKIGSSQLDKKFKCTFTSWLHRQTSLISTLYVHTNGLTHEQFQQFEAVVTGLIQNVQKGITTKLLLCPWRLVQKVMKVDIIQEGIGELYQFTERKLIQPKTVIRKLATDQQAEEQKKMLVWNYLQDIKMPKEVQDLIQKKYIQGVGKFTDKIQIQDKCDTFTLTFNRQSDSLLQRGSDRFLLKKIHQACEMCYIGGHLKKFEMTAAGLIGLIPINWEQIVKQELEDFLKQLNFSDFTYLHLQEGIVLDLINQKMHYLAVGEGSPQDLKNALSKLKELKRLKNSLHPYYESFYQIRYNLKIIRLPVHLESPEYQNILEEVKQAPAQINRIQNIAAFNLNKKFRNCQNMIYVFSRGDRTQFDINELVPLESTLTPAISTNQQILPSTNDISLQEEESKAWKLEGRFIMYQLYFSSQNEVPFEYDGSDIDPTFFDFKFQKDDLLRVRNSKAEVFLVPKEKGQLLPLYELLF